MPVTKELMYPQEYQDRQSGETKTRWIKMGVLIEFGGKEKIKLETLPVEFFSGGGWIQLFEPRKSEEKDKGYQDAKQAVQQDSLEDEIPF